MIEMYTNHDTRWNYPVYHFTMHCSCVSLKNSVAAEFVVVLHAFFWVKKKPNLFWNLIHAFFLFLNIFLKIKSTIVN